MKRRGLAKSKQYHILIAKRKRRTNLLCEIASPFVRRCLALFGYICFCKILTLEQRWLENSETKSQINGETSVTGEVETILHFGGKMSVRLWLRRFSEILTSEQRWFETIKTKSQIDPVCILGHFFRISLEQPLLLRQAAFFPSTQLSENFRKNKINKQKMVC